MAKKPTGRSIQESTASYEKWLGGHLRVIAADLDLKHQHMAEALFPFLRATFYRFVERWPEVCPELQKAPAVLAVGDLHVENFGTWRDAEGRLVWGVNDFDEVCSLPYTQDLVRLATSARIASAGCDLAISADEVDEAILAGYNASLAAGGEPRVLAERCSALREMARYRLADPEKFWRKLALPEPVRGPLPAGAEKAINSRLPDPQAPRRIVHRIAGLGSLGRERFTAIVDWHGGKIAREVKALAPSAAVWAAGGKSDAIRYAEILEKAVRCPDPFLVVKRRWIVRRLAPDCTRIELTELPKKHDATALLTEMGWETANVHLGSGPGDAIRKDLAKRPAGWLEKAAKGMVETVQEDWEAWRKGHGAPPPAKSRAAKRK